MFKRQHLCVTCHDPALAIAAEGGKMVATETTERLLQYKRARHCQTDNFYLLLRLLCRHCPDADVLLAAFNWRQERPLYGRRMDLLRYFSAQRLLRPDFKRAASLSGHPALHHMPACYGSPCPEAGCLVVVVAYGENGAMGWCR